MKTGLSRFIGLIFLVLCTVAVAEKEPLVFEDASKEERFGELTLELRCLVCQNQNLADSDAPLAQDLRKEIYDMLHEGQTDDQIKTFMIDRYGDFVLYRPPVQGNTLALWLMPAVLLLIGTGVLIVIVRKRSKMLAQQEESTT